jgi:uncharacterized coiled-coil protein SlyX
MTADESARIGRLEREMAGVTERVDNLAAKVDSLVPLSGSVAELKVGMSYMQAEVHDLAKALAESERKRSESQEAALRDSQQWRRSITVAWIGTFGLALGAVATIVTAVLT